VPGPLITGREESFWRNGGLVVICIGPDGERGKGYRPRFALATPFGLVGQDAEEPGAERGTPGEAVDALQDTDPCLLDDLFGNRLVGDKEAGETNQPRMLALDEGGERLLVATAQGEEQLLVVVRSGVPGNARRRRPFPGQHRTSFSSPRPGRYAAER